MPASAWLVQRAHTWGQRANMFTLELSASLLFNYFNDTMGSRMRKATLAPPATGVDNARHMESGADRMCVSAHVQPSASA